MPSLKGLRLGIARDYYFAGLDPAVAAVAEDVLRQLADAGVTIVEADLPGLGALVDAITLAVQVHDVVPALTAWMASSGASISFDEMLAQVSPDVRGLLEHYSVPGAPHGISEEVFEQARDAHLPALRAKMAEWFAAHRIDAMLLPAAMIVAAPIGEDQVVSIGGEEISFTTAISRNIAPGSTAGLPGLVLPAGLAHGLPVAIELDGPAGSDRRLLGIGLAIEALLGPLPLPFG